MTLPCGEQSAARILVIDDQELNVDVLTRILERAGYLNLRSLTDPARFMHVFSEYQPDLVLLDLHMPGRDGFQILKDLASHLSETFLPVLILTGDASAESKKSALSLGAKDFLAKPFDQGEVLLRIHNLLEARSLYLSLEKHNAELGTRVRERTRELELSQGEVLERLASAAEFRDGETSRHTERVGEISGQIARALGFSSEYSEMIKFAARLHDIGKIGIPDSILLKPGKLTPEEFAVMASHTVIGARILSGGSSDVVMLAERIALSHHEKWDGTGYPHKLRGDDIPVEARIVAAADVLDALSHPRAYRPEWPRSSVLGLIQRSSGLHFDPAVVSALFSALEISDRKAVA
ncbi:MAG TPA: HD domain-containing phosphohydrolase [Gemmatimonadaceae bacterium]|nr:HD domain-containing phosphohydrolase [Gemmatimonadaceae bacterium]